MKKIYKALFISISLLYSASSFAGVHNFAVQASSFAPSTVNAVVGDTIVWTWVGGPHTTTSTSIPSGAASWDFTFSAGMPAFAYQVTVPGTYDFICSVHGFAGQIIVSDPSGITSPDASLNFNIYSVKRATYEVSYSLHSSADVKLSIYDLTGKSVRVLSASQQTAGEYNEVYFLEDLQSGIYLVELFAGNQRLIKRIIID